MKIAERIALLEGAPLFGELEAAERESLAELFTEKTWRKGQTVCREGDPGETFLVVASGELEVWGGEEGSRVINRLGRGDVLGEMSLLLEGRRSATVTAARSARLLELDRSAFQRFFASNPRMLHRLAELLCQRLARASRAQPAQRATTVVDVAGPPGLAGKTLVASSLAALLRRFTGSEVLLVRLRAGAGRRGGLATLPLRELERCPADRIKSHLQTGPGDVTTLLVDTSPREEQSARIGHLNALIATLSGTFPSIVLDVGGGRAPVARAAGEVSDFVVELVDQCPPGGAEGDGASRLRVVNLHNRSSVSIPIHHCQPFVLPDDPALHGLGTEAQVERLLELPSGPVSAPLRRLARKILGRTVGLAIGGGAAFGIAHIGAIRVFEDNDVPIDLVAGTSMGSIVGIGYAAGLSGREMEEIALRVGTKRTTLSALDFTLSRPGILAGKRLVEIFSPLLGPVKRFDQLIRPCRAIAADVESGETVWIGEGPLERAFRASCSVPMIWTPVPHEGRVLVDGSMVDPVPAGAVREMGADLCIAVNVVPPLRKGVENVLTRLLRRVNRLNPLSYLADARDLPSTFDVIMNSMQMLQHELGAYKAISADVRITPDLSAHTWIEFYRPQELIERGAEAAERALPAIRRVLAEARPSAP